ncbi:MAG: molybdopterin-guanine dinucleotide biosynthesis protein B [Anaerolineaceae bacterium]|nr:molybdopterin-guanine dinucleotide biosynthesis protein B [Anaerolineaceae bacterium]
MKESSLPGAVIGFYGYSKSGKTSLIIRLVSELKREGYKIAVIKRTDKWIHSEPAGKDTGSYRAAGAKITAFSSKSETNFVMPTYMKLAQILENLHMFMDVDLVIVEGAYDSNICKIRLGEIPEREKTIFTYDGDFSKVKEYALKFIKEK